MDTKQKVITAIFKFKINWGEMRINNEDNDNFYNFFEEEFTLLGQGMYTKWSHYDTPMVDWYGGDLDFDNMSLERTAYVDDDQCFGYYDIEDGSIDVDTDELEPE